MMTRTTLIFTLVSSILTVPSLCAAGIAAHGCVCDVTECCDDETSCEFDPCSVIYEEQSQRRQAPVSANAQTLAPNSTSIPSVRADSTLTPVRDRYGNRPFPSSDLPLRI